MEPSARQQVEDDPVLNHIYYIFIATDDALCSGDMRQAQLYSIDQNGATKLNVA